MPVELGNIQVPATGQKITADENGRLNVPTRPIVPFIEGDGTGPDIWHAAMRVLDAAVQKAYAGERKFEWMEVLSGGKAFKRCDSWLARYITKRSWRGVHRYDHRLNDLIFQESWVYTYRDPERFWFDLSNAYRNCIAVTEVGYNLEIALNTDCNLQGAR